MAAVEAPDHWGVDEDAEYTPLEADSDSDSAHEDDSEFHRRLLVQVGAAGAVCLVVLWLTGLLEKLAANLATDAAKYFLLGLAAYAAGSLALRALANQFRKIKQKLGKVKTSIKKVPRSLHDKIAGLEKKVREFPREAGEMMQAKVEQILKGMKEKRQQRRAKFKDRRARASAGEAVSSDSESSDSDLEAKDSESRRLDLDAAKDKARNLGKTLLSKAVPPPAKLAMKLAEKYRGQDDPDATEQVSVAGAAGAVLQDQKEAASQSVQHAKASASKLGQAARDEAARVLHAADERTAKLARLRTNRSSGERLGERARQTRPAQAPSARSTTQPLASNEAALDAAAPAEQADVPEEPSKASVDPEPVHSRFGIRKGLSTLKDNLLHRQPSPRPLT